MGIEAIGNAAVYQAQTRPQAVKYTAEKTEVSRQNVENTAASPDPSMLQVNAAEQKEGHGNTGENAGREAQQQANNEQIKYAVEKLNRNMNNSEAVFGIHEGTNRVTIKIVDKDTKEVIKELPPEKTLDMIAKMWEMAGILVDERR